MGSEVIEVVERRRRWSTEHKLAVLMDALEPGASVTAVADRHGVSRNLVYTWLRLAREGRLSGIALSPQPAPTFMPVEVLPHVAPASAPCPSVRSEPARTPPAPRRRPCPIETNAGNPLLNQPRVLPCGQSASVAATGEQMLSRLSARHPEVVIEGHPGVFGQLEPHGPASLFLADGGTIHRVTARRHIINADRNNVTAP
jgi:transposase